MKFWFLPFVLLVACESAPPLLPAQPPGPTAGGHAYDMSWSCEETDVNNTLVWVRCEFANYQQPIKEACIRVTYKDRDSHQNVAESRNLCSGPLWAGGTSENYAAFFRENRVALAKFCGPQLEKCYMDTTLYYLSNKIEPPTSQ